LKFYDNQQYIIQVANLNQLRISNNQAISNICFPSVNFVSHPGPDATRTYITSNNGISPKLVFNSDNITTFLLEPKWNSPQIGHSSTVDSTTNILPLNASGFKIILDNYGTYDNLDLDPLLNNDPTCNIYINKQPSNAPYSYALTRLASLLTVNVVAGASAPVLNVNTGALILHDSNPSSHTVSLSGAVDLSNNTTNFNATAANGLTIICDASSNTVITVSGLTVTTNRSQASSAVCIVNQSANAHVDMNGNTFSYNSMSQLIKLDHLLVPTNNFYTDLATNYVNMGVGRKLTVRGVNTYSLNNLSYFIVNNDSVILDLTCNLPSNVVQSVYWPALYYAANNDQSSPTVAPLVGTSVAIAEAWDKATTLAMGNFLGTSSDNAYNVAYPTANGYKYGIIATSPNTDYSGKSPYAVINNTNGNLQNLKLVAAAALATQGTASASVNLSLVGKTFNDNTKTSHTGKLLVDSSNNTTSNTTGAFTATKGWVNKNIDFAYQTGVNNLVLFSTNAPLYVANDVTLRVNINSGGDIDYASMYKQVQDQTVNGPSIISTTVTNYLLNNFRQVGYYPPNSTPSGDGVPFSPNAPNTVNISAVSAVVYDYNFDNNFATGINSKYSVNIHYDFVPIKGSKFNFIQDVMIDVSWNTAFFNVNQIPGTDSSQVINNIVFKGIDNADVQSTPVVNVELNQILGRPYTTSAIYTRPVLSAYNVNQQYTTNFVDILPPNQIWSVNLDSLDSTTNPSRVTSQTRIPTVSGSIDPNFPIYNSTIDCNVNAHGLTLTQDVNPKTGERVYTTYSYVSIFILNGLCTDPTAAQFATNYDLNYDITNNNLLQTSYNNYQNPVSADSTYERGTVLFERYDSNGNILSGDGSLPFYNTIMRFRVTTIVNNMRDLPPAPTNLSLLFKVGGDATQDAPVPGGGPTNLPAPQYTTSNTIRLTNVMIPLYIDVHVAEGTSQIWNDTNSYSANVTWSGSGNTPNAIYYHVTMIMSGVLSGGVKPLLLNGSNEFNMTSVINQYFNNQLSVDASLNSWANNNADNLNNIYNSNINNSYTISGFNNSVWKFTVPVEQRMLVGDFSVSAIINPDTNISSALTSLPYSYSAGTYSYSDKSINNQYAKFIVGKALDSSNSLESVSISSFNLNAADTYNLTMNNTNTSVQPTFAASTVPVPPQNLSPYNKYTKYFIAFNTQFCGINIDSNKVVLLANPNTVPDTAANSTITFSFTDEYGNAVNDIALAYGTNASVTNGNNLVVPIADNSNAVQNVYYDGTNYWQYVFFNRISNSNAPNLESSYGTLNISYAFGNASGNPSNTKNLNGPLVTVDYSKVGLVSANMSQVFLGNWRIMPSGDGQSLLFRFAAAGQNPYDLVFSMDEANTKVSSTTYNNSTLQHISVPLPGPNPAQP
jgi:hypothetical protein